MSISYSKMNVLVIQTLSSEIDQCYTTTHNHQGDSGFDLFIPEDLEVPPKALGFKIKLGIKCQLSNEKGWMLLPRSSMGSKTPLRLSNSVGIIDSGYRGEIMAVVDNLSDHPFQVEKGSRLFQMVPFCGTGIHKVVLGVTNDTGRGSGGFGSTGK